MVLDQLNIFIHLEKISTGQYTALTWKNSEFAKNLFLQFSRIPWFSHQNEQENQGNDQFNQCNQVSY